MRNRVLAIAVTAFLFLPAPIFAQAAEEADDIVRLPGQAMMEPGHRAGKPDRPKKKERLVAGGGMFVSFDTNGDGVVTAEEISAGAEAAFLSADANQDDYLSALEQIEWAQGLPIRDDALSNPAYFDPNLDRMVSHDEFMHVVEVLTEDYAEGSGDVLISPLRAPKEEPDRRHMSRMMMPGPQPGN